MVPPRHFVKRQALPVGTSHSEDISDFGNSWVLLIKGFNPEDRLTAANKVFDLIKSVVSSDDEELRDVKDIKIYENGKVAFVIVSSRRTGDIIRDGLHNSYVGRGHRLNVEFSDRGTLQSHIQQSFQQELNYYLQQQLKSSATSVIGSQQQPLLESSTIQDPPTAPFGGYWDSGSEKFYVDVEYPNDIRTLQLIHMVIENVLVYGPHFELALMEDKKDDVDYEFLFNHIHPLHIYYRWKLLSLSRSGTSNVNASLNDWETYQYQGFKASVPMELSPSIYFKPPLPPETLESEIQRLIDLESVSEATRESRRHRPFLGEIDALHLNVLLRHLSYDRGSIARVMAFAIDHEGAAQEVVDIIYSSIIHESAQPRSRIARLWTIGDILVNVGVASEYQAAFRKQLPRLFDNLREYIVDTEKKKGRLSADRFRRQILQLLDSWRQLNLFVATSAIELVSRLTDIFLKEEPTEFLQGSSVREEVSKGKDKVRTKASFEPEPAEYDGSPLSDNDLEYYEGLIH